MALHLEAAAVFVDAGVPQSARVIEFDGTRYCKRKCGSAAVAIRELEIRIAFADSSKFAAAEEVIAHVVEVICTGTYDVTIGAGFEFEQVARPALSSREKSASKTIIVGSIPIAVILALEALVELSCLHSSIIGE